MKARIIRKTVYLKYKHQRPVLAHLARIGFCISLAVTLCSCAVNPATKKMELMLVSEAQERSIGQGVDKQVREEMGIYREKPELRNYIRRMGGIIGRNSDRPDVDFQTEIVDTPDFNAFAVPGGFVYVHRGLLEKMNSADELASVMGHEMAHVAARHSASQISKSQVLNVGLVALDVASGGELGNYGQLVGLGAALAFSKFSRNDEREADHFGTRYMAAAGYNPKASIDMMKQIQKLHEKEPTGFELWFMTHPATSERIENLTRELDWFRQNQPDALNRPYKRNEFIALLDGLAIGQWNGKELVKDDQYWNKEHALKIKVPKDWVAVINHKEYTAIFAHPKDNLVVFFNVKPLNPPLSTAAYFDKLEKQLLEQGFKKKTKTTANRRLTNGALSATYVGMDESMNRYMAEGIAFVKGGKGYSFFCLSAEKAFAAFQPVAESLAGSIRFISPAEANAIQPDRLRIHRVSQRDTWAGVTKKYFGSSQGMNKLADYNGFTVSDPLFAGMLLKIPPKLE